MPAELVEHFLLFCDFRLVLRDLALVGGQGVAEASVAASEVLDGVRAVGELLNKVVQLLFYGFCPFLLFLTNFFVFCEFLALRAVLVQELLDHASLLGHVAL